MRITIFLLLVSNWLSNALYGQSCGCDKTITSSSSYLVDGVAMNIQPGDTICIMAGTRTNLTFRNLAGLEGLPIVIINCGGKAVINSQTSYGMKFERSHHFKITGTGSADTLGLEVKNAYHGIYLGDFTTDFEIDHVDIHDIPFAGIMAKTDPVCSDTNTWRKNFTMRNIFIHHNYIHNTINGEGMYIGYSFYANGISCGSQTAYPHAIENIKVHHNKTSNTGCEGIQVGCAITGCEINDNIVEAFGQRPFSGSNSQQNGIQIGEGTGGTCYNNFIKADPVNRGANGIILLGIGDNLLYNNVIVNPGMAGLFVDERPPALITTDTVIGYWLINNTIINPGTDGIKTYAELVDKNEIKNNIIVNPGSTKYINTVGGPGVPKVFQGNNYFTSSVLNPQFVNANTDNYRLNINSPCIDAAENAAHWNIFKDKANLTRPKGIAFEIGAFEFDTTLQNMPPAVYAGNDTIILSPQDTLSISGIVTDPDGLIDTYYWSIDSPDTLLIVQENQLNTVVKYLQNGINRIRLSAIDNGNKQSTDELLIHVTDSLGYMPLIFAGKDTSVYFPVNQIPLNGSIKDSLHLFKEYRWRQIAGPSITLINDSTSLITFVSNLQAAGNYIFRLTVKNDSMGKEYYDETIVRVLVNNLPLVNAGADVKFSNGIATIPLNGTVSDSDGSVVAIVWTQIGGTLLSIQNVNSLNTQATGFSPGSYSFQLNATDNLGASASDQITVIINSSPVANAGSDLLVSSLSATTISGTGNDPDGDAVGYLWTKVSGPSAALSNTGTQTLSVSGLQYGIYTFRLKVSDTYGDFTTDDIILTVNRPPVANAGDNINIRLSQSPYTIRGSGTDADGTIASYNWTKVSGGAVTMSNTNTANMVISNLQTGTYVFKLTVTDNRGASSDDSITIKVRR